MRNAGWGIFVSGRSVESRAQRFFRPFGTCSCITLSHGLRRGLYSYAASRLSASRRVMPNCGRSESKIPQIVQS